MLSVDNLHADQTNYTSIIVGNIPPSVNDEVIEVFFESKKKGAGSPVKNVRLNRTKHWAIVEFEEHEAVSTVMSKVPISLMDVELSVQPYQPLIADSCVIHNLEIRDLPEELAEELLAKDIDETLGLVENSCAEYDSEGEKSMNFDESYDEYIVDIIPIKLRMLEAMEYSKAVAERFPGVKFEINFENNRVDIRGKTEDVVSVKLDLYKTLSSFCVYNMKCISPEMFEASRVMEYINSTLDAKKLICTWDVQNKRLVICSHETHIAQCCDIIEGAVKETVFPVCTESAAAFLSSQWQNMLAMLRKDNEVMCKAETGGRGNEAQVHVIAMSNAINAVVEKIKSFLKQQLRIDTETFYTAKELGLFFAEIEKNNPGVARRILDKISSNLPLHHVCINVKSSYGMTTYNITGTAEGRLLAKNHIINMVF